MRRVDTNDDETQIISDSENEEEEDDSMTMSLRASRWQEREKRLHVQDMSEDEMMALALRLSKQEACSATQIEQLEDADLKKAIAESLNVSQGESNPNTSSSVKRFNQDQDTAHLRRKLSFPSHAEKLIVPGGGGDNDAVNSVKWTKQLSPLPPMPDLSQRNSPQPYPLSLTPPSVPSSASHDPHLIYQKDLHVDSAEDEPSQSSSQHILPVSMKLGQDQPSTCKALQTLPCTNESSISTTCPDPSQPSPPKSPAFVKTDPKGSTKLTEVSELIQRSPSHENVHPVCSVTQRCQSLSGRAKSSASVSGLRSPGLQQEALTPIKMKPKSHGTTQEKTPLSEKSLSANIKPVDEFTSDMTLHLSDDYEDDDEDEDKVVSHSPVFPQECVSHTAHRMLSPTQLCCSPPPTISPSHTANPIKPHSVKERLTPELSTQDLKAPSSNENKGLVSYYWGVPFCPKGVNPDEYTRVILTQLEVYEKSLKEAQHQLLHKAEWSLPVLPCPAERPFGRRLKRHRAPQRLEEEGEEEDVNGGEEKNKMDGKEGDASQSCTQDVLESSQNETYVVVSSPEPQEEQEKPPLMFGQQDSANSVQENSTKRSPAENLSDETQIHPTDENKDVPNGSLDPESTLCPETQMTDDDTPELMVTSPTQPQSCAEGDRMEVDEKVETLSEANEKMEHEPVEQGEQDGQWRNSEPAQIQCPMCSRLFPLSKIELHAAYCDGSLEDQTQQENHENHSQVTARRKRTRRLAMDEENSRSENRSAQQEKCYVCQKLLSVTEYYEHVDHCIEKKNKPGIQETGLLAALNQTEHGHSDDAEAGPSDTTSQCHRGSALIVSEAGEIADTQALTYNVSSSPIKSFTPVSEVTDCLIDFTKQYSAKTNHRFGRKRKYKR